MPSSTYSDEKLKAVAAQAQCQVDGRGAGRNAGRSETALDEVLKHLIPVIDGQQPAYKPSRKFGRAKGQDGWFNIDKVMSLKFRAGEQDTQSLLSVGGGNSDLRCSSSRGGAVPGDRIVGVLSPGVGIRIFQIHSPRLKEFEQQGWIDVTWDVDPTRQQRFPAQVSVTAVNAPGSLAEIAADDRRDGRQHR